MISNATLQSTQPKKEVKINPKDVIGGLFEDAFETLTGSGTGFVNEGPARGNYLENLNKMPDLKAGSKFPNVGELSDFQTPRAVEKSEAELIAEQKVVIAQAESILKQSRAGFVTQEEVRYEVADMSAEDRNRRLRLNTSLRKEHTEDAYHMAELYRQAKEEISATEQRKENTGIPSPAKQPNSLEVAFEGKSGSTGNLSFQAVG